MRRAGKPCILCKRTATTVTVDFDHASLSRADQQKLNELEGIFRRAVVVIIERVAEGLDPTTWGSLSSPAGVTIHGLPHDRAELAATMLDNAVSSLLGIQPAADGTCASL
ncbi:hypothetical protein D1114_20775 [Cereibacter sphaeroides]|uniref:Uncharacterized protein n=1 Tax=Cereibacter sphaeroides TaxID=1063 RepID=A0AAX1UFZ7_CERSP|nr:hypothetical protein [Cereibacter sphaeroides]RHZ91194.1 hypothetical protein D1114_20775 [Cereibacter sphaeroides]